MKYQIEDIKEGVEFIIDDDQTFDELIEFYLPFRLSELSSLDPSKPGDYDSDLIEAFFRGGESPEIKDWADKVVTPVNSRNAIRLYVALAAYADKHKADRVLALDIIYCLIGLNDQSWADSFDNHNVSSHIEIAEQVAIQWGEDEIAKFLVDEALGWTSLVTLALDVRDGYFGILSKQLGPDLYFDRAKAWLDEEDYEVNEIGDLVNVVQLSLEHLDNDKWAREIYKNYLERHKDSIASDIKENGIIHSWGSEIILMAESISKDLKDKKWEGEIYKDFMPEVSDDEIKEIKDMYAYLFKKS